MQELNQIKPLRSFITLLAVATLSCTGEFGELGSPSPVTGSPPQEVPIDRETGRRACENPPPVRAVEVPMRRLTPQQYAHAIEDLFGGAVQPSAQFPTASGVSTTGFTHEPGLNRVDALAAELILLSAEDVALQIPDALSAILPCAGDGDAACAGTFMDTVARRAYRRALTSEERSVLQETYDAAIADQASFGDAVAMMTAVLVQSPQFLYVPEIGESDAEIRRLSGNEIATRLSLLLWDSIPDEDLLTAAERGDLQTADGIAAAADRMLGDPRADRMVRRFFREWMHVDDVAAQDRDGSLFPEFTPALSTSMSEGFTRFTAASVREGWTLEELLTTPRVPMDSELASHYGQGNPADWEWSELAPEQSIGLMTQPLVMTSLAHPSSTSYVHRGVFLTEGLLCLHLGVPPGNAIDAASAVRETLPPDASARDESDAIRATSPCGGCHNTIDPPGLAFEQFDAVGQFRDRDEAGNPIETDGEILAVELPFDGPRDLMEGMAADVRVSACFDRQWFRYFAGRTDESADACALDQIAQRRRGTIRDLLLELARSDAFAHRQISAQ